MAPGEIEEGAAIVSILALYRTRILPRVGQELAFWRTATDRIADPELRAAALASLSEKAANPEATAVFACLTPRRGRAAVVRASVAFQVAVDYLDTLGEQPAGDPLADGLALHGALVDALSPAAPARDWYAERSGRDDGGYLGRLVGAVRAVVDALPASAVVLPVARAAAERCGEGQARTHLAGVGEAVQLKEWAEGLAVPTPGGRAPLPRAARSLGAAAPDYSWWELAAGGASSAACHALLALAATPGATAGEAELVDAAYFPSVGALTVLLDDLVDREADRRAGEHNFLDYYDGDAELTERLAAIVVDARGAIDPLPHRERHRAILAGVLAFYLAAPSSPADAATETVRRGALARASAPTRGLARALSISA
jgi:tetraprenyl-beta-curcumene synthase